MKSNYDAILTFLFQRSQPFFLFPDASVIKKLVDDTQKRRWVWHLDFSIFLYVSMHMNFTIFVWSIYTSLFGLSMKVKVRTKI